MLLIINDVLDFSKIEAGGLKLQPSTCDIRAAVDEVIELARPARKPEAPAENAVRKNARLSGLRRGCSNSGTADRPLIRVGGPLIRTRKQEPEVHDTNGVAGDGLRAHMAVRRSRSQPIVAVYAAIETENVMGLVQGFSPITVRVSTQ